MELSVYDRAIIDSMPTQRDGRFGLNTVVKRIVAAG